MTATSGYEMMAGLPQESITRVFHGMKKLELDVRTVLDSLAENQDSGNQWILVLGLTRTAIQQLANNDPPLQGLNIRFQWEGTAGLIKVIPGSAHGGVIDDFTVVIRRPLDRMGVPWTEARWKMATTYRPTVANKGKQGDQAFLPASRQTAPGQVLAWPTLVIETGVAESWSKLREDAKWWFQNSDGEVRIVILISIRKAHPKINFEKWQLMPPLTPQPAATQRVYAAQEVQATPSGVLGAPMIIPFEALMDRVKGPSETDVIISSQDFQAMLASVI